MAIEGPQDEQKIDDDNIVEPRTDCSNELFLLKYNERRGMQKRNESEIENISPVQILDFQNKVM